MDEKVGVKNFLQSVKETITKPIPGCDGWILVPRQENKECILHLGFKYQDIFDVLLELSVEDYCEGPCRDLDQPGELWVFGKVIENKDIYIKMKLASFGTLRIVRVISFHFAEKPLSYQFKGGGTER